MDDSNGKFKTLKLLDLLSQKDNKSLNEQSLLIIMIDQNQLFLHHLHKIQPVISYISKQFKSKPKISWWLKLKYQKSLIYKSTLILEQLTSIKLINYSFMPMTKQEILYLVFKESNLDGILFNLQFLWNSSRPNKLLLLILK